ncbi:RipA family octameric membrane protein [Sporichthya polymorpha]|uniref:RipA family octameric membrane protein n=1 Tax=Sporichthya polymorpha TaxID=35751 RepID=UPI0003726150|nr:hypothetical protein [Sporichthya polymorpha]
MGGIFRWLRSGEDTDESDQEKQDRLTAAKSALAFPPENAPQYFELYKLMVQSSEALVSRRGSANTYFVTLNGALATAVGLILQRGEGAVLAAASILVLSIVGAAVCIVWRLLLISFGQLNRGKFVVINSMEEHLAAAIYRAEWIALGKGEKPSLYKSFTEREALVPIALAVVWGFAVIGSLMVMAVA